MGQGSVLLALSSSIGGHHGDSFLNGVGRQMDPRNVLDIEHLRASIYHFADADWLPYNDFLNNCWHFANRTVNNALFVSRGCTQ